MYNLHFWIKYLLRVLHIGGVIILGGNTIYTYLFPCPQQLQQAVLLNILAYIVIISGFINVYILDPRAKMLEQYKYWAGTLHLKTVLSIVIMTPIFEVPHVVQFYYIIVLIVISPFLRFYREASTELHRPKEVTQFEEIQQDSL